MIYLTIKDFPSKTSYELVKNQLKIAQTALNLVNCSISLSKKELNALLKSIKIAEFCLKDIEFED